MGKLFGFLIVIAGLSGIAAVHDLSSKRAVPSADKCSGYEDASLPQQLALRAWVFTRPWTVVDLGVVRIASTKHPEEENGEFVLIQVPFTGGLWFKS